MVPVNNTLVCGAGFFRFSWPPTHYRVSDQDHLLLLHTYITTLTVVADWNIMNIVMIPLVSCIKSIILCMYVANTVQ